MFWAEPPKNRLAQSAWILRDKIMQGDLKPGDRLVEQQMAAVLSISRPSMREVLRVLAAEGLVEQIPNCGYSVTKLDLVDIEKIHEVWALLTGEAVYEFTRRANKQKLADLKSFPSAMRSYASNRLELLSIMNGFFNTISEGCENHILSDLTRSLVARINFVRALSLKEEIVSQWADDFDALLKLIARGEARKAQQLIRKNIRHACNAAKQAVAHMNSTPLESRKTRGSTRREPAYRTRTSTSRKRTAKKLVPRARRSATR